MPTGSRRKYLITVPFTHYLAPAPLEAPGDRVIAYLIFGSLFAVLLAATVWTKLS